MQLVALVTFVLVFAACASHSPGPAATASEPTPPMASPLPSTATMEVKPLLAKSVAVETAANLIFVSARLNRTETMRLLLDTGASYTVITTSAAKRLGLSPEHAREWRGIVVPGGRELQVPVMPVRSLAVGHAELEGLGVGVYDAFPDLPTLDGVLGGDFLKRFRLTVDHHSRHIVLEQLGEPAGTPGR